MSTFDGCVTEFPDIRIDYFRNHSHTRPPLACFLSHVHTDHLAGLDALRSPFVYCSAATREILLRLERYPCRINYARGILEARQQTYKHLHKVLKPLPLETPTQLELRPGCHIQVTLFDANHCPGAVMFLIEDDTHAILYTGDIRSEPWFVNAIGRNPNLVEYTSGIRTLDKIYLDTSFIHDVPFQTKAKGLAELISKVKQYPKETVFHIQTWTYGYEDVWIALSRTLKSRIHVDEYKLGIYNSLKTRISDGKSSREQHLSIEAPALTGFTCGNAPHLGCLTAEQNVRLHSCEKGNVCSVAQGPNIVRIQPVIAHLSTGNDIPEVGVGGGGDDLEREAELDTLPQNELGVLLDLLISSGTIKEDAREDVQRLMLRAAISGRGLALNLDVSSFSENLSTTIQSMAEAILKKPANVPMKQPYLEGQGSDQLPRTIRFPYSRHSSYAELCHLASIFTPKDIWPCTVDVDQWLREDITIQSLFGHVCSATAFSHDRKMEEIRAKTETLHDTESEAHETQQTNSSHEASHALHFPTPMETRNPEIPSPIFDEVSTPTAITAPQHHVLPEGSVPEAADKMVESSRDAEPHIHSHKRGYNEFSQAMDDEDAGDSQQTDHSIVSFLSSRHSASRWKAYYEALGGGADEADWQPSQLISTDGGHSVAEEEL